MRQPMTGIVLTSLLLGAPQLATAQGAGASPEDAVFAMVETYQQAIEAKDESSFRRDLYRGEIPGDDRRFLRALFDRTEHLNVELETRELRIEEDRAMAVIDCTLTFRHSTTGEQKTAHYTLRLIFEPSEAGWRLKKFERA